MATYNIQNVDRMLQTVNKAHVFDVRFGACRDASGCYIYMAPWNGKIRSAYEFKNCCCQGTLTSVAIYAHALIQAMNHGPQHPDANTPKIDKTAE